MKQLQSLSHTVWECKYHIVWIPKYRKKVLYGKIREELVAYFMNWPTAEAARYWKGTCVWIMCTCYCRFHLNMGWQK